jgi:hypothetical protein
MRSVAAAAASGLVSIEEMIRRLNERDRPGEERSFAATFERWSYDSAQIAP